MVREHTGHDGGGSGMLHLRREPSTCVLSAVDVPYSFAVMSRPCAVNAQITVTSMTIIRIDHTG
jgi:hypothetical protein